MAFDRSGQPEIAATLYGASTRRAIIHTVVDLPEMVTRLRAALGNAVLKGCTAAGAALELGDAVGYARRHLRHAHPGKQGSVDAPPSAVSEA